MKELLVLQAGQMEFRLSRDETARLAALEQRCAKRAQWWFGQMRRVVNQAMDWSAAPPARPEQVYFRLPKRVPRHKAARLSA